MRSVLICALLGFIAALMPPRFWLFIALFILSAMTATGAAAWFLVIRGAIRASKGTDV